jgi:hypothetical protein
MIEKSILKAFVLTLLVSPSQAATLEFQGLASVDKGSGFGPAFNYMQVDGGDRIRALKDTPAVVAAPPAPGAPDADSLPAGVLLATGIGAAVAVTAGGDDNRAASP